MVNWQYPPYVILLVAAALVSGFLVVLAYQRRHIPGATTLLALMLGAAVWSVAGTLENLSLDAPTKLFWSKATYFGIVAAIAAWTMFVFSHTGRGRWLTPRTIALLCIEPVLVILLVWTNEAHGLIWSDVTLQSFNGWLALDVSHGIGFWMHAVYSYVLLLLSSILLLRALLRSPEIYRGQVTMLLIAAFAPWIGNGLFLTGISPIDLTPFAFTITGLVLAWGVFRFQLLDIVPVARDRVLESIEDAVFVLDPQNRIVDLNPAARGLLGAETAQRVIGQPTDQLFPHLHEQVRHLVDEPSSTAEITIEAEDNRRVVEVKLTPLYDRTKRLIGRAVIIHEITALKNTEQQIRAQNEALIKANQELESARNRAEEATRLKSQFLATMSHELRTPLNAVIGYSDIVLAGMTGELTDEQRHYQNRILVNAEHLLSLINDILDLSKVEAGRMEISRQPFVLRTWVDEMEMQTRGLFDTKGLNLTVDVDKALPEILSGDPARLKQVILNLLSNAAKFTESGSVRLDIRKHSESIWTLAVSDTGIGIPSHMQDIIFEEFRQVDETSRRAHGGTGLGLSIVRKFVLLMGGSVRVTSEIGAGSTFTVTLPLVEEPVVAANEPVHS